MNYRNFFKILSNLIYIFLFYRERKKDASPRRKKDRSRSLSRYVVFILSRKGKNNLGIEYCIEKYKIIGKRI